MNCVHPTEGRFANVTNAGLDAMDAEASLTSKPKRTAKSCGPDAPTLVSSRWMHHSLTTVAKAAGHRGEHEVSC